MNTDKKLNIIMKIIRFDCEILDIGNRIGSTHYIDFLIEADIKFNIMKGIDYFRRSFIVIKTEYILQDGSIKYIMSTFFQRYTDEYLLWCGCGFMMNTEGGMCINQLQLIYNLISNGYVDIDDTIKQTCRLLYDPVKIQIKI
jgi:hypothetical protein